MLEKQRHQLLLDILDEQQFASVNDLSSQLNASEATIRRDITKLAKQDQLRKIRGGAEVLNSSERRSRRPHLSGTAFLAAKEQRADVKRLLAKEAVKFCEDGEFIIINGGSSTYMMREFLAERHLNVLTNSFVLAQELAETSDNQITLPGGELYRKQGIILSAFENDTIQYYQASKMFMGTPGIGKFGVMESDPLLIQTEQKLKKQADQLIVLADSTKLGKRSNFILCPLSEVDVLITDSEADPELVKYFESENIQVILVDVNQPS
ncbi:DeoR/GlpR family DNA-binding transcription regulator [Gilvimarinus xylanilyticus]|uniref:DeoR/GlpR family DNA-binding transcription regulator n=1 Tax=Gilvimarinus xylanilyticus TaxID=2944139 RepID=A0A9X2KSZ5_9GAMM|nr:DeoR/GlpR family DNA-binding transcription regulator [Gilvimarinus xylanilyticus]MCP8898258.1 DeoR/GlpR family DNA-binding transcription regulator [Gilvimarinus xylanilyticus]